MNRANVANIQGIGDKCFNKELYGPSKIMFTSINNNSKLALCYINLEKYRESASAVNKSKFAWVSATKFRLVATYVLELIKYTDHVEEVMIFY